MTIVDDFGIPHYWDDGKNYFLKWGESQYGFKHLEDAWDAYWFLLDELKTSLPVDGVYGPDGNFVNPTE